MLGFSAATMNAYQNGSPSALEGEAEQTRDVPTANLATGLVDKAKALQQSTAWEDKTREKAVVLKDTMQKLAKAARLVGRGMRAQGRAEILEAAQLSRKGLRFRGEFGPDGRLFPDGASQGTQEAMEDVLLDQEYAELYRSGAGSR